MIDLLSKIAGSEVALSVLITGPLWAQILGALLLGAGLAGVIVLIVSLYRKVRGSEDLGYSTVRVHGLAITETCSNDDRRIFAKIITDANNGDVIVMPEGIFLTTVFPSDPDANVQFPCKFVQPKQDVFTIQPLAVKENQ